MKPLNDYELDHLLSVWVAPNAPPSLEKKILPIRFRWWRWLLSRRLLANHWRRTKRPRKV